MTTFADIQTAIQAVADAGTDTAKLGLGSPGSYVRIAGASRPTGQAWGSNKAIQMQWEGYAAWYDATTKAKINQIVASLNQLIADHDSATVPTTAPTVTPIP